MAHSRSYEEQLHAWRSWRDATGPKLKDKYLRYVELANEAARLNGIQYKHINYSNNMCDSVYQKIRKICGGSFITGKTISFFV